MPLYDYQCRDHGSFREWRAMSESDLPMPCPTCDRPGRRMVSAPRLSVASHLRKAHAINEKSANEPRVVRKRRDEPIPVHDAHRDLSGAAHNGHDHEHHHDHGEGGKKTLRSNHPWAVRH